MLRDGRRDGGRRASGERGRVNVVNRVWRASDGREAIGKTEGGL